MIERIVPFALSLCLVLLAGCATGDRHPELRPYSAEESRQLALEDLNRRGLSFEEYQARKQQILTQPYVQQPRAFDAQGEVNAEIARQSANRRG